jgi:hypothetical protein
MKAARIAGQLSPDGSTTLCSFAAEDCNGNLLLLECLLADVTGALRALGLPSSSEWTQLMEALNRLGALLGPLVASVPAEAREELRQLTERGAAPSPFCVR